MTDDGRFSNEGAGVNWGCILCLVCVVLVWGGIYVALLTLGLVE
jgi:hypothetical protein